MERQTNNDLMRNVYQMVRENGHYDKANDIMDYFLPEDYDIKPLTDYRFDFWANVGFGGSESIYVDCYIRGCFNENTPNKVETLKCGTFKTLREDISAMKIMGELCGALTYYATKYVNDNLDVFTPDRELKAPNNDGRK